MAIDHELLKILACPEDKGELLYFEDENIPYNPRTRRAYPIREGIPVLLISEAEAVTEEKHAELTRR